MSFSVASLAFLPSDGQLEEAREVSDCVAVRWRGHGAHGFTLAATEQLDLSLLCGAVYPLVRAVMAHGSWAQRTHRSLWSSSARPSIVGPA
jgi:hypothetical protein